LKILIFAGKATTPDIQSHSLGWSNALSLRKDCDVRMWNGNENISSFDIFDTYQPDVFWCHSRDLTRSLTKVLLDSKFDETKAIIFLNDYEDATEDEKKYVNQLKSKYQTMFSQNFENYLPYWSGIRCFSCLPAADITRFKPKDIDNRYYSPISFIGQWEPSKEENIKKYIYPYLDFGIKIYGFGNWSVANHLGIITNNDVFCNIISNSDLNLSVTNNKGYSPSERIFKILACKGRCLILGANKEYENLFGNYCMVDTVKTYQELIGKISTNWILDNHTYEHRINQVFNQLEIK